MTLLGGELSGAQHRAVSLGRLRRWGGLAGFVRFPLTWLLLRLAEPREAEEEQEEDDTVRQDTHGG